MTKPTRHIDILEVSKQFGAIQALRAVSLHLDAGEVVGLIGDNGAGKSTLIKVLSGVYPPDAGQILVNGEQIRLEGPRHAKSLGIETVHQERGLVPAFRVSENLFLGRERTRCGFLRCNEMDLQAQAAVEGLGIAIRSFKAPISTMSGGQQQAVAVARAVSTNPRIVILDEPTAALAVKEVGKVLDLMCRLRELGVAVVFISHVLPEILTVTDRIVVLRRGEKVGDLPTADADQELLVKLMIGTEMIGCG